MGTIREFFIYIKEIIGRIEKLLVFLLFAYATFIFSEIDELSLCPFSFAWTCLINWGRILTVLFICILVLFQFLTKERLKQLFMKKIDDQSIKNGYCWRLLVTFLILIHSIFLALAINSEISEFDIHYTFVSLITLPLLFYYVYKSQLASILKKYLDNTPYNIIRAIATEKEYFNLAIILAVVTLVILTLLMNDLKNQKLGSAILDISYTIIGGFFSVLIYFKIEDKTISLRDYMNKFIKILDNSKEKDLIYIIAPTLFVGQEYHNRLHEKFKRTLFERIGKVRFVIANLSFEESELVKNQNDISVNGKSLRVDDEMLNSWINNIKKCSNITSDTENVDELIENKKDGLKNFISLLDCYSGLRLGLFSFHTTFVPINEGLTQRALVINIEHHLKLISFYKELTIKAAKFKMFQDRTTIFKNLNWLYYKRPEYTKSEIDNLKNQELFDKSDWESALKETKLTKSANFFAIANITQGDYYIGQFRVFDNKIHEFHGTSFENKNISKQMETMLNGFIDEYPIK